MWRTLAFRQFLRLKNTSSRLLKISDFKAWVPAMGALPPSEKFQISRQENTTCFCEKRFDWDLLLQQKVSRLAWEWGVEFVGCAQSEPFGTDSVADRSLPCRCLSHLLLQSLEGHQNVRKSSLELSILHLQKSQLYLHTWTAEISQQPSLIMISSIIVHIFYNVLTPRSVRVDFWWTLAVGTRIGLNVIGNCR